MCGVGYVGGVGGGDSCFCGEGESEGDEERSWVVGIWGLSVRWGEGRRKMRMKNSKIQDCSADNTALPGHDIDKRYFGFRPKSDARRVAALHSYAAVDVQYRISHNISPGLVSLAVF